MPTNDDPSARERWARLRLLVIGQLLAAPPVRGELIRRLTELSRQNWRHPIHGRDVRFGVSTLERWLALARSSPDPASLTGHRAARRSGQRARHRHGAGRRDPHPIRVPS